MERKENQYDYCKKCIAEITEIEQRFDSYKYCHHCPLGAQQHKEDIKSGDPWGTVDWNNFQYKDYYKG